METPVSDLFRALGTIFISILGLTIFGFGQFLTSTRRAALALIPTSAALFFGISPLAAGAYPVFAQQLYASPLDATEVVVGSLNTPGHLPTHLPALPECTPETVVAQPNPSLTRGLSTPHCWNPESIFDVVVSIPTDRNGRTISSGGIWNRDTAALNVGGVIALPEGFKAVGAADSALTIALNSDHANDIVFGRQTGQPECTVGISCQAERKDLPFSKYPLIAGGNRGRGQIYPHGTWDTYNSFRSQSTGVTVRRHFVRGSSPNTSLAGSTGGSLIQHRPASSSLPAGPALTTGLAPGSMITFDGNPNVGGFGQAESSIVVQSPARILYHTSV